MLGSDFESSTAEADHSSDDSISDDEDDGDIEKTLELQISRSFPAIQMLFAQDDGEADDDEALEAEEERALLEEIERSGDFDHPSAVMMMGYESEDDVFDSDLSFDNESFLAGLFIKMQWKPTSLTPKILTMMIRIYGRIFYF